MRERGYADQLFRSMQAANFYAASYTFTAAAAATDVFTIAGSSTKKITVWHASVTGTQTTASNVAVSILKRSTANSGGTSAAVTMVPIDSAFPAPTATVLAYTANPTTGTLVGTLQNDIVYIPDATTPKAAESRGFITPAGIPVAMLNGAGESLCINLNGATIGGNSLCAHIIWSEA